MGRNRAQAREATELEQPGAAPAAPAHRSRHRMRTRCRRSHPAGAVLREFASLVKTIVLIGQGNKFEIWDETTWNTRRAEWLAQSARRTKASCRPIWNRFHSRHIVNEPEHVPVLLEETLQALKVRKDGFYVDATCGRGGHTRAILSCWGPRAACWRSIAIRRRRDRRASARCAGDARIDYSKPPSPSFDPCSANAIFTAMCTASCSTSACPRRSSTCRGAVSVFGTTARSTCAWIRPVA